MLRKKHYHNSCYVYVLYTMSKQRAIQEVSLPMARRKTRRTMFIISGATLTALALIAGAILVTYQITINAHGAIGSALTAPASGSANTIQATTKNAAQQTTPVATANKAAPVQIPGNPTPANNGKTNTQATQPNTNTFVQPLKLYGPQIQHKVAQGLNISDRALATQLQAGKHLKDIAQAQGISASITSGFAPAIQSGQLTQAQVSSFVTQTQQNPQMLEQTLSVAPPPPLHW